MDDTFLFERQELLRTLRAKGIHNEKVLRAIEATPRHLFVPPEYQHIAYEDTPIPIEGGQTISQPYVVARMTSTLIEGRSSLQKVLEIGTGSGYQAAVLAHLASEVYSIERIKTLLTKAKMRFQELGLTNIYTKHDDGSLGWEEHSPYEGIIVTAGSSQVPQPLLSQLANAGRLIIPIGDPYFGHQLQLITREDDTYKKTTLDAVLFVPLLSGKVD